ncbi:hypothetical protein J8L70_06365 [Pseudoalteromonas sp. MMG010]|uniref:hypothetical protein n=1 Tax=Pseudoalteromonas sp. MMG010 TaxID=2822685 RepID=UPI001B39E2CB|nr:hypothetical protein [Pseudoalteromonas sp. MMG010]MBQ4832859.1 hypothetical protein [Pseudoalteromonas sp. MMG010]
MDLSIQLLRARIAKQQLNELDNDFKNLTSQQQVLQLKYLFQSALRMDVKYQFMQNAATHILATNQLPAEFISQFTQLDELVFFTPALKVNKGFMTYNEQGNGLLHTLFSHADESTLPFNYIRSLMLFESNEDLLSALATPNAQGLTPVACYIAFANKTNIPIKHEFSALLALIEIEQKQNSQYKGNLLPFLQPTRLNEPTLLLSAAYLQRPTSEIARLVKSMN